MLAMNGMINRRQKYINKDHDCTYDQRCLEKIKSDGEGLSGTAIAIFAADRIVMIIMLITFT